MILFNDHVSPHSPLTLRITHYPRLCPIPQILFPICAFFISAFSLQYLTFQTVLEPLRVIIDRF